MTTKRKTKATPAPQRHSITVELCDATDQVEDALARTLTRPETQAAATMHMWDGNYEVDALTRELSQQTAAANRGDLTRAEGMLIAQAHTLDAVFNKLARLAHANFDEHVDAGDRYMRLALKAQSQCRATVETLAEVKNPMTGAFVRQANIAAGHQQVNNGIPALDSRARESEIRHIELSGGGNELLPDTRASQAASRVDPTMEAVGKIDRAAIRRR